MCNATCKWRRSPTVSYTAGESSVGGPKGRSLYLCRDITSRCNLATLPLSMCSCARLLLCVGAVCVAAVVGAVTPAYASADSSAQGRWVAPQGLPKGHNGGHLERLTAPSAGKRPHVVVLLMDDVSTWRGDTRPAPFCAALRRPTPPCAALPLLPPRV